MYSEIVSMIRKYHNHTLRANLWHREEEPHNYHKTKQSNQLSLPHPDDRKLEWTYSNAQQNLEQLQDHTMGVLINNDNRTTSLERTAV